MIDLMPNMTLFVQMGIFIFVLLSMHFLIFRPVLRILAARHALTEGAQKEAKRLQDSAAEMLNTVSARVKAARDEGLKEKSALTRDGETHAHELVHQSRQVWEGRLEESRAILSAEARAAQESLRQRSQELSKEMTEKLLGRKVSA